MNDSGWPVVEMRVGVAAAAAAGIDVMDESVAVFTAITVGAGCSSVVSESELGIMGTS